MGLGSIGAVVERVSFSSSKNENDFIKSECIFKYSFDREQSADWDLYERLMKHANQETHFYIHIRGRNIYI